MSYIFWKDQFANYKLKVKTETVVSSYLGK